MVTLMLPKTRDNKPYRLRCRFGIEPWPFPGRLAAEKVRWAEVFVDDMHLQGWEFISRYGVRMLGPFPKITPVTIRPRRTPSAREMLDGIMRGERFLDKGDNVVRLVPPLAESEWWEYELAAVFYRPQIMVEVPDLHEEER